MLNITDKAQAKALERQFSQWQAKQAPRRNKAVKQPSALRIAFQRFCYRVKMTLLFLLALGVTGEFAFLEGMEARNLPPASIREDVLPLKAAMNPMLPALVKTESNGDCNAVSKKGARGCTQIMPATAINPGYGVAPMRDNSVEEQLRVGNDYLNAMQREFGSPVLAAAAYNAGPSAVEKALKKAKGNHHLAIRHLPKETRDYVRKVAGYVPPTPSYEQSAFVVVRAN